MTPCRVGLAGVLPLAGDILRDAVQAHPAIELVSPWTRLGPLALARTSRGRDVVVLQRTPAELPPGLHDLIGRAPSLCVLVLSLDGRRATVFSPRGATILAEPTAARLCRYLAADLPLEDPERIHAAADPK